MKRKKREQHPSSRRPDRAPVLPSIAVRESEPDRVGGLLASDQRALEERVELTHAIGERILIERARRGNRASSFEFGAQHSNAGEQLAAAAPSASSWVIRSDAFRPPGGREAAGPPSRARTAASRAGAIDHHIHRPRFSPVSSPLRRGRGCGGSRSAGSSRAAPRARTSTPRPPRRPARAGAGAPGSASAASTSASSTASASPSGVATSDEQHRPSAAELAGGSGRLRATRFSY